MYAVSMMDIKMHCKHQTTQLGNAKGIIFPNSMEK